MRKIVSMGLALVAALSLTACDNVRREVAHRPGELCSMSQRGQTAPNANYTSRLTCAATYTDRVLRWR